MRSEANPTPDIRLGTIGLWIGLVVLIGSAGLFTLVTVDGVADPQGACENALPWFEGLEILSADRTWLPPAIRCSAVDTDPGQAGEVSNFFAATAGDVAFVAILDLAALVSVGWVYRRFTHRRSSPPANS
ncbi:MAG: hypothetical protein GY724_26380 [Actinomycetia bacterium]|nr:hypothetical protein [Actinomycetes bacterium]